MTVPGGGGEIADAHNCLYSKMVASKMQGTECGSTGKTPTLLAINSEPSDMSESIVLAEGFHAEQRGPEQFAVVDASGNEHSASPAEIAMIREILRLRSALECAASNPSQSVLHSTASTVALATRSRTGMRMTKATSADLKAALALVGILDDIDHGELPFDPTKPFTDSDCWPASFDAENREHLRMLHDRIKACLNAAPGGLFRVIVGMSVVLDPKNAIVDPDSDVLLLHPRLKAGSKSEDGPGSSARATLQ